MIIGGLQWTTLLDYPDHIAATLFTAGCGFRCPFCHNAELVLPELVAEAGTTLGESFFDELADRHGFLDAVVISGGEPTLQSDLLSVLKRIKDLGYLVKLDTNGVCPDVLQQALEGELVDYVAMDIKAPLNAYDRLSGVPTDRTSIQRSVSLIQRLARQYEFRTTVAPGLIEDDLMQIGEWLSGSSAYWLQMFRAPSEKRIVNETWRDLPALDKNDLEAIWEKLRDRMERGGVRG